MTAHSHIRPLTARTWKRPFMAMGGCASFVTARQEAV